MKKVIVTGATSMVGAALVEECIKNSVEVLALVRSNSANLYRLPDTKLLKVAECNLDAMEDINEKDWGNDYDVLYHFGWADTDKLSRGNANKQARNVFYSLEAVKLAKRLGCYKFVGAGSQAEYGIVKGKISENTGMNPQTAYGVAKYAAERLSGILCNEMGMEFIWGRIFSVYGPYDNPDTMISYAITSLKMGISPAFTSGLQLWDYLYSEDAGRAFFLLGELGLGNKVYCIANGKSRPLKEYIEIIHSLVAPEIAVRYGEMDNAEKLINLEADISALVSDTGFSPVTDFEGGVKKIMDFRCCNLKRGGYNTFLIKNFMIYQKVV